MAISRCLGVVFSKKLPILSQKSAKGKYNRLKCQLILSPVCRKAKSQYLEEKENGASDAGDSPGLRRRASGIGESYDISGVARERVPGQSQANCPSTAPGRASGIDHHSSDTVGTPIVVLTGQIVNSVNKGNCGKNEGGPGRE